jgi:S1-C subfamily serine protease
MHEDDVDVTAYFHSSPRSSPIGELYKKVVPSLVKIADRQGKFDSGVLVGIERRESIGPLADELEGKLMLTAYHVYDKPGATTTVLTNDGGKYTAKMIASRPKSDLALFKLDVRPGSGKLPTLSFADNPDEVVAFGFPLQVPYPVAAPGRILEKPTFGSLIPREYWNQFRETDDLEREVLKFSGAIRRGMSGGPMVSAESGELVGINQAYMRLDGNDIGLAATSEEGKGLLDEYLEGLARRLNKGS